MNQSLIQTIPNNSRIAIIEYYPEYAVTCSIGGEPFHGTMDIMFEPQKDLLEFMSFEKWLSSIATQSMTIEELCRLVFDELSAVLGDIPLRVAVHARTTVHAPVSAIIERKDKESA